MKSINSFIFDAVALKAFKEILMQSHLKKISQTPLVATSSEGKKKIYFSKIQMDTLS